MVKLRKSGFSPRGTSWPQFLKAISLLWRVLLQPDKSMSLTAFEQDNLGTAAVIPLESTLSCKTKQANTSIESGSTAYSAVCSLLSERIGDLRDLSGENWLGDCQASHGLFSITGASCVLILYSALNAWELPFGTWPISVRVSVGLSLFSFVRLLVSVDVIPRSEISWTFELRCTRELGGEAHFPWSWSHVADRDRAARLSEERSWTEGKTFPHTSLILTDLGSCLRRSTTLFRV